MTTNMIPQSFSSTGARSASTEGRALPLVGARIECDAAGGLARVQFTQTFENRHPEPLHVTYKLPLPADAAVGGFAFEIGGKRSVGKVETKKKARETFEEAILQGRSAALLDQETSSLFTQELGNVPPGATVSVEVTLDCPLAWLGDAAGGGAWEFRFPLAAAPRYLGGNGSTASASELAPLVLDIATSPIAARASLSMRIRDALAPSRSPESPSHPLQTREAFGAFHVELGSGNKAELDRDVVVRWPVGAAAPKVSLDACVTRVGDRAARFGLLTLVPPALALASGKVRRDVTILLDTSGSMQGSPLDQAKRIASGIIESLDEGDTFEVIEFGNSARAYKSGSLSATKAERKSVVKWIQARQASGGTEMLSGVQAALANLGSGAQRQIVLITDGLIGEEGRIVGALANGLPTSSRFHAVGVGAAANRSLLMPIARAGRGAEAIVGIGEDAEPAVARLLRQMCAPIVIDLVVEGSALEGLGTQRLPDLFAASPARIPVALRRTGGVIELRGRTHEGPFCDRIEIEAATSEGGTGSDTIARLYARERVEDLELDIAIGRPKAPIDAEIERIGLDHRIATRLTSFVAVSADATVDPTSPTRREVMPHVLAHGMSAEGVGLTPPMQPFSAAKSMAMVASAFAAPPPAAAPAPLRRAMAAPRGADGAAGGAAFGRAKAEERDEPMSKEKKRDAGPPAPRAPEPVIQADLGEAEEAAFDALESEPAPKKTPAPPRDAPSLWNRMKRAIVGDADDEVVRSPAKPTSTSTRADRGAREEAKSEGAARLRSRWVARFLQRLGKRIVLELDIQEDGFVFTLFGATSSVRKKDGARIAATFDLDATTRAGTYAKGQVVRIVLTLADAEAAEVDEVVVILEETEIHAR